ncbi:MAG: capsule biosynthesis protein [Cereibacter sphaeroides]|uniref:Capsule biosynthesis protein n=1 Tax=Cereibacter sphaeroides TaxID=1063 RepID=A0A2W5UPF6_CERSP|nr:MAG: capsule biosynthesis protein [Cereibacter sphaeroides]
MTTKPKAIRFRTQKQDLPPPDRVEPPVEDGFGPEKFPTAAPDDIQTGPEVALETEIDRIRREGLTGRQLRMARRVAQKHNLPATSDFDAVRLLRKAGIDPFQRTSMLELVTSEGELATSGSRDLVKGDGVQLPQTVKPTPVPSPHLRVENNHAADILRIQTEIARRRRRKTIALAARLAFFIALPTIIAAYYYYFVATPLYATHSEMVIQQADGTVMAGAPTGGLGSMLGGALEANKDSIAVQGYLMSRDAMERLDQDHGFRAHFSGPNIDPLQRLAPDASNEAVYALYQRVVKISYDPTEGIIKMDVMAADPATSAQFSRALIHYAEQQIDHLTQRKREDQMRDARKSFEDSQANMLAAQRKVVELQQRYQVMSSEAELGLATQQIATLETQLTQERLALEQMRANESPNKARMDPVERRIATLESQIAQQRQKLTQNTVGGMSLAEVQSELLIAQADVQTRQLMLASTLQQLENARIEANRQVRYLSLSVSPTEPDEPAYPRAFENTLVTLLIFAGIYLMISMTAAILREQVTA